MVHGDDFTAVCNEAGARWLEQVLQESFEIKTKVLGEKREHEIVVLNRKITWGPDGIGYEADLKHVGLIVEKLGLQDAKGVTTPGADDKEGTDDELGLEDAHHYRQIAARCNYLAADRPDAQFAVKEICKDMSKSTYTSWAKLKRLGRYLKLQSRLENKFAWQDDPGAILVFSDSDWAGDRKSRKSTSGGCLTIGQHLIKSWSKTQKIIALSSGEAELYSAVKAVSEAIGLRSLIRDLGSDAGIRLLVDARATMGMLARKGLGSTKHIEASSLWVQEHIRNKTISLGKVDTLMNPADMLTKNLDNRKIIKHCNRLGCQFVQGVQVEGSIMMVRSPQGVDLRGSAR